MKKLLKKFSPMLAIVPVLALPLVSADVKPSPIKTLAEILVAISDEEIDVAINSDDYKLFTKAQVDEFKTSLKSLKKSDETTIESIITKLLPNLVLIENATLDKIINPNLKGILKALKIVVTEKAIAQIYLGLKQADLEKNLPNIKKELLNADFAIKFLIGTSVALAFLNLVTILVVVMKLKKQ